MADASSASLTSVIVGGLLTMGGGVVGFVGSVIRDAFQASHDKKQRSAEKFEELVSALYEFDHWVETQRSIDVFGKDKEITVSPLATVQSISAVYFPQFDHEIGELDHATSGYRYWMAQAGQKRLAGNVAGAGDGFKEAYKPYKDKRDALLDALKKFAHSEFQ